MKAFVLSGVLLVISTILFLYPMDGPTEPRIFGPDKIVHYLLFFAMVLPALSVKPMIWVWLVPLASCYGILIELIQPYFGRGRDVADMVANALGALSAIPVARWLNRRFIELR